MYQSVKNCPLCGHDKFINKRICKDYLVSKESFAIVSCKSCGFEFTNPRPTEEHIKQFYQSDNYISHGKARFSFTHLIYPLVRKRSFYKKLSWIKKYSKKSTGEILDVGCGTGSFLNFLQTKGWKVNGIESQEEIKKEIEEKHSWPIYSSIEEHNKEPIYDVITLWHVLEHLHHPKNSLKRLVSVIKEKGTIMIALPNRESEDALHYQENWAAYDVPRHLSHFTKKDIVYLAQSLGLKVKAIEPMKYDAYYVSILSEKNKGNFAPFITGLTKGWRSNKKAKEKGNYSSLLYVLKKKKKK